MDRKSFIRNALAAIAAAAAPQALRAGRNNTKADVKHKGNQDMKTTVHRANSRGHANHGWLDSHHSFSFANYYNPDRMNFGVLRVLNDDVVAPGKGFGTHPHDNMEIISIPLEGDLEHKDSMGNTTVIKEGDVQVMSAGTGVFHSEYNANQDEEVRFLQIWVFPNKKDVSPRYDQISIRDIAQENQFYQILSPREEDQGVWIHQDAWFHLGDFEEGVSTTYALKKEGNGVYVFVLEGEVEIDETLLGKRDALGITGINTFAMESKSAARVLLMEVPMSR